MDNQTSARETTTAAAADGAAPEDDGVERVAGIEKKYNDQTHVFGRIWGVAALVVFLLIPISISIHNNAFPSFKVVMEGLLPILLLYGPSGIVEVMMYTPLMGPSATYVSFVTGNISNLKLPCSLAALQSANVKVNSDEGEVLSTIAVATSSIVTTLVIAIFCIALTPVIPYLTADSSPFAPAFTQVVPALFGALAIPYMMKNKKLWEVPLLGVIIVLLFNGTMSVGILIVIAMVISILGAFVFYRTGVLDGTKHPGHKRTDGKAKRKH